MEKVKGEDDASYELWKKRGRMGVFTVVICMFFNLLIAVPLLYVGYRMGKTFEGLGAFVAILIMYSCIPFGLIIGILSLITCYVLLIKRVEGYEKRYALELEEGQTPK